METDDTEKELESAAILEDPEVKELAKKKDEENYKKYSTRTKRTLSKTQNNICIMRYA